MHRKLAVTMILLFVLLSSAAALRRQPNMNFTCPVLTPSGERAGSGACFCPVRRRAH